MTEYFDPQLATDGLGREEVSWVRVVIILLGLAAATQMAGDSGQNSRAQDLLFATLSQSNNANSAFENFRREMMPQVGKKISVVGILTSAKLGWLVTFKG